MRLKLSNDTNPLLNTVTAYGDGYIEVNRARFEHAVAFGPEGEIGHWPVASADEITTELLRQAAGLRQAATDPMAFLDADESSAIRPPNAPEVLLVGTGPRQRFLHPSILQPLFRIGIGVETMDTQAAARTYNILMAEGRRVVVALLPA